MWRWIVCIKPYIFYLRISSKPQTLTLNPSRLPLTCIARLVTIQSTNVESSLRSWIRTCVCIIRCEGHRLLLSNVIPINFAFYVFLEAELFWIWDWASHNWCFCNTLPSIVDEHIETMFCAFDDNGEFKVCFLHWFSINVNIISTNNGLLHQMLGVSSMLPIWCVGCFHIKMEGYVDLCNTIYCNLKGQMR